MEIINLKDYKEERFDTAIALGNFDGLHLGHQELIKTMVAKAKELDLRPSLFLFKQHTKSLTQKNGPKLITNNELKIRQAKKLGVQTVYIQEFNEEIMKLSGEEFIKNIIVDRLRGKLIVVGFDYKFGYKASGNVDLLKELCHKYDIKLIVIDPVENMASKISSSAIREIISSGDMKKAHELLARPYTIIGKVINGSNRGNKLGFPTANIDLSENFVLPKKGVYASYTIVDGNKYLSATNIGTNPTFGENYIKIETYILDYNENIYGKTIEIEFLDFLRDDIKFDRVEDLVDQMNLDIDTIRKNY